MEDGTIDGPPEELSHSALHCCKRTIPPICNSVCIWFQLTESESSAETCQNYCEDKDIPFFRLNPRLNTDVFIGEPNLEKIFSMILQTQNYLSSPECKQSMDRLLATIQQLDTNCVELDARYDALLAQLVDQLSQVN